MDKSIAGEGNRKTGNMGPQFEIQPFEKVAFKQRPEGGYGASQGKMVMREALSLGGKEQQTQRSYSRSIPLC